MQDFLCGVVCGAYLVIYENFEYLIKHLNVLAQ